MSKDKDSYEASRTERNDLEVSKDKVSYKARRTERNGRVGRGVEAKHLPCKPLFQEKQNGQTHRQRGR